MRTATLRMMALAAVMVLPQEDVKVFKLASGEALAFPFVGGIPKPSESELAIFLSGGPAIAPEGKAFRLSWVIGLKSRGSALRDVSGVKFQEVSGKDVVTLFTGTPKMDASGTMMIIAPAEIVSRSTYPFLYTRDRTILVFRVELERPGLKPDVLLQPVLIGPDVKTKLEKAGYLREPPGVD